MQVDTDDLWKKFPKQAVYSLIFNEDRTHVLMVKRRDLPVWVLPGGGLDQEETPEIGAQREVLEESGFQVKILRKVAEYFPVNAFTQYTHLFECAIIAGTPQIGAETQEICFYPVTLLKELPPPFEHWILDGLAGHSEILRKQVEGVTWWRFFYLLLRHPILVIRYLLTKMGVHFNS